MGKNKKKWYLFFAAGFSLVGGGATGVQAGTVIDSAPAWPLCGRITEDPAANWQPGDDCPMDRFGRPEHSDFPLNATYGPRILPRTGYKLDFHQGIDISTPIGTPVFAIARGEVIEAGPTSGYDNPMIQLRHYADGAWGNCPASGGCTHSLYMHLSGWVVSPGQTVEKGRLIGFTGASNSGYEHLHMEIRQAPLWDPSSSWNCDAIHPLEVLPYSRDISETLVFIDAVDVSDPMNPQVELRAVQPSDAKTWDVVRVEVEIFDNQTGLRIVQPGEVVNPDGYHVYPPFFDMVLGNREYGHKDSSSFPWESFDDCPFVEYHGSTYNGKLHIEHTHPDDPTQQTGYFNGIISNINRYVFYDEDYELALLFEQLQGLPTTTDVCVVARAVNARGEVSADATWNCGV